MDVFSCPSLWYLTLSVLWVSLLGIPKTLISIYHCDLSDYWQRIVVNWLCSDWSNVSSGVPQGTVLVTALFFLYINDLSSGISSEVRLFADDTVLFWQICCPDDHHRLQHEFHQLEQWAAKWQMRFAPTKCFVLSVTLRTNSSHFSYRLCDTGLEEVKYHKYLGVYITSSLSWSLQCEDRS